MAREKPIPTGSTNLSGEWRIIFEISLFKRKGLLNFCRDLLESVDKMVSLMPGRMKEKEETGKKARVFVEKVIELRHFFPVGLEVRCIFLCRIQHLFYFALSSCGIIHPFHLDASKDYILMSSLAPTSLRGLHSDYWTIHFLQFCKDK